jgi:hypothetical protein
MTPSTQNPGVTHETVARRSTDALLLSIWVYGYFLLIRMFGALQRLERLAGSPR